MKKKREGIESRLSSAAVYDMGTYLHQANPMLELCSTMNGTLNLYNFERH